MRRTPNIGRSVTGAEMWILTQLYLTLPESCQVIFPINLILPERRVSFSAHAQRSSSRVAQQRCDQNHDADVTWFPTQINSSIRRFSRGSKSTRWKITWVVDSAARTQSSQKMCPMALVEQTQRTYLYLSRVFSQTLLSCCEGVW